MVPSLQLLSACAVDTARFVEYLTTAGTGHDPVVDAFVAVVPQQQLVALLNAVFDSLDQAGSAYNALLCYTAAKASQRQLSIMHLHTRRILTVQRGSVNIIFAGFKLVPEDGSTCQIECLQVPAALVSAEDHHMLHRISQLKWMRMDHLGECYDTLVECFDNEEEAMTKGVTKDTERLLSMIGREDTQEVEARDVSNKWAACPRTVMMSTRPHDEERVDGDDMMARFNPDPDCWPGGFQRRVYMIKWVHDESSADRLDRKSVV